MSKPQTSKSTACTEPIHGWGSAMENLSAKPKKMMSSAQIPFRRAHGSESHQAAGSLDTCRGFLRGT